MLIILKLSTLLTLKQEKENNVKFINIESTSVNKLYT